MIRLRLGGALLLQLLCALTVTAQSVDMEQARGEWRQALLRDPSDSLLRSRIQLTELRRGVARELARPPQYVVAAEFPSGKLSSPPLRRPSAVHARSDGGFYVVAFGSGP